MLSLAKIAIAATVLGLMDQAPPAEDLGGCMRVDTEARPRAYGYDHLVHLTSRCQKLATCQVATDVAPEPREVLVAPGEATDVVTFVGSPAREFSASVRCAATR